MRLAVMSDVHGNLPALEAVLQDLQQYEPDGVIVAGDFVGGPHPVETIRLTILSAYARPFVKVAYWNKVGSWLAHSSSVSRWGRTWSKISWRTLTV